MLPKLGAVGAPGNATIITSEEAGEIHPASLVTVKLCDPMVKSWIVTLVSVPVIAPGLIVQLPEGKSFNMTLPVASPHVG